MARLPSDADIGVGDARSGRPIASYDTTGYARGAAAIAKSTQDLGASIANAGGKFAAMAKEDQAKDDQLELARARADFLTGKVNTDTEFKDDQDYTTLPKRYGEKINEIARVSSERIRSPRARELFTLSVADDVARGTAAMGEQANKKWRDHTLADATTKLDGLGQGYLLSADPAERTKMIDTGNALLDSLVDKNIISRTEAVQRKKAWVENQATALIDNLPAPDRANALSGFSGALKRSESGGDPTKVNQLGYAGLYQFGAPRLAAMGVYQPGSDESLGGWSKSNKAAPGKWSGSFNIPGHPEVRNISDFLKSPVAQETAFKIHTQKMDQEIKDNGFEKYIGETVSGVKITREGLHAMMHLGGVGGARDALTGKGNAKDANGTSVLDYAARLGQQGDHTRVAALIPESKRVDMLHKAETEVARNTIQRAQARSELHERAILDASAGVSPLPSRVDIENDTALDEPRRNTLLKAYDKAAGDVVSFQQAVAKFDNPNGGAFNPYDKDDRDNADRIFERLGGTPEALQKVVDRTGIMPKSAAKAIRGDLVSNDPKRVQSALTMSSNLLARNQNAFAGSEGQAEIENNAVAYRHYVEDFGMSGEEAANKLIKAQSPEFQAQRNAKIKNEDLNELVKKKLSPSDIAGAFDTVPLIPFTDPKVGFDPASRQQAFNDYAEMFRDRYLETGDVGVAKAQALAQMKKTWGASTVSGSATLMKYPPEKSPAFAGVENASALIAKQAVESVKEATGQDVERKGLRLAPIPGVTAQAFRTGAPAPYMLMWTDKDGTVQMLNPGKAFLPDANAARATQTEERQASFDKGQAVAAPYLDRREQFKENQRAIKEAARQRLEATKREVGIDVADR